MKTLRLLIFILAFTLAGFAQTNPDYSGEWTLDLARSKTSAKMPFPALSKNIAQSAERLEILNDSVIKTVFPDSKPQPLVYLLDGTKIPAVFGSGVFEAQITTQAGFNADRNLQITKTTRESQNQLLQSETTTTELWQLLDQGKTLKISSNIIKDTAQSDSFELIYVKTGSGTISSLESQSSAKQQKSDGIINGRAVRLVTPPYPPEARKTGANGNVFVEVLIDEKGNVVLAKTIAGNPALATVSEQSALLSKFSPTKLKGAPVSVTGIIVYTFTKL